MTQSADGSEALPQPPHASVQADEQAAEAGSSDGEQSADEGQDLAQSQEAAGSESPVQHPSLDDAEGDPWGQAPLGGHSAPAPPWSGQGGYPDPTTAAGYYEGQIPGPFGQGADGQDSSGSHGQGQASAGYGQEHSPGAEGYTPGSFGQDQTQGSSGQGYSHGAAGRDRTPGTGVEGYPLGRFGQRQVPAVDAEDYASGEGQPGQQPVGPDRAHRPAGHDQGLSGESQGQMPGAFGQGSAAGAYGAPDQGQGAPAPGGYGQHGGEQYPQDSGYPQRGGEQYPQDSGYPQHGGEQYSQDSGYPRGGGEQYPQESAYPQDPGYPQQQQQQQQRQPGLRPEVVNPFLEQSNAIPRTGMRRAVYRATFGAVNLGPSDEERAARARRQRVARPLHGSWRVVVMSIKGGVGKTTTAAMLGRTLAEWRGDRVVALDTNPDMGTLGDRLVGATDVTVRGLLAHEARAPIQQVAEVNRFTNLAGRLHVLANEQDPAVSEDFTGSEYQQTLNILERFYNVIIADCGTGVLRPWVRDMLALANTLVVVAEPKGDAATRAAGTLDWIAQHGFHDLVARSVAVINYRSPTPKSLDVDALTSFFAQRCRAVCKIRYDEHLDLGVQIQYDPIPDAPTEAYVADATKEDYLEFGAIVADEFR